MLAPPKPRVLSSAPIFSASSVHSVLRTTCSPRKTAPVVAKTIIKSVLPLTDSLFARYLLSFHTLPHSFAFPKVYLLSFHQLPHSFRKTTRVGCLPTSLQLIAHRQAKPAIFCTLLHPSKSYVSPFHHLPPSFPKTRGGHPTFFPYISTPRHGVVAFHQSPVTNHQSPVTALPSHCAPPRKVPNSFPLPSSPHALPRPGTRETTPPSPVSNWKADIRYGKLSTPFLVASRSSVPRPHAQEGLGPSFSQRAPLHRALQLWTD
jgi:hypothetical protein